MVSPCLKKMTDATRKYETVAQRTMSGVNRASMGVGGWLKREANLRETLNSTMVRYLGATALAGGIYESIKLHAELQDSMTELQKRTGESDTVIQKYRGQFQQLAAETGISAAALARQAAEQSTYGKTIAQSFERTRAAAIGSVIAQTDLVTVGNTLQTAMDAFNISDARALTTMAQLDAAADSGRIGFDGLGEAISKMGGLSQKANASLPALLTGIETLSTAGVGPEQSMMALMKIMNQVTSEKTEKNFKKFGKSIGKNLSFYDAAGNMKPFEENLGQIGEAFNGLGTDMQRNKFIELLFGSGMRGNRDLPKLLTSLGNAKGIGKKIISAGDAEAMAEYAKRSQDTAVQLAKLEEQSKNIAANLGKLFAPAIASLEKATAQLTDIAATGEVKDENTIVGAPMGIMQQFAKTRESLKGGSDPAMGAAMLMGGDLALNTLKMLTFQDRNDPYPISGWQRRRNKIFTTKEEEENTLKKNAPLASGFGAAWLLSKFRGGPSPIADEVKATIDLGPLEAAVKGVKTPAPKVTINNYIDGKLIPSTKTETYNTQ